MPNLSFPVLLILLLSYSSAHAKILALGDSLTFGYGVAEKDSWPQLLSDKLGKQIVNGGTAGATSAFGPSTLKFHLKRYKPELVIYALGANDGLRGLDPKVTKKHIAKALDLCKQNSIPVLLVGMRAPPNYGKTFPKNFAQIYPELAKQYQIPLYPFLLDGVAGHKQLNQPDGIHPNKEGYMVISEKLYTFIKKTFYAK